jgi:hypothetical protein
VLDFGRAKRDIHKWMSEERQNADAWFTTMFDLYALPSDFPGHAQAQAIKDPYQKVRALEAALGQAVGSQRFIPYIQLHEFEALLLADPQKLGSEYLEHTSAIETLVQLASANNPEEINDRPETAPSKRIIAQIPQYEHQKAVVGPVVAQKIGLPFLRQRCWHFNEWLSHLEGLRT